MENRFKKLWTIGDIHGEDPMLELLLEKLFKKGLNLDEDGLVFTGDYVDRGKYSFEVLKRVKGLQEKYPNVIALKGNHEDLMIKGIINKEPGDKQLWQINGGRKTIKSFFRNFDDGKLPMKYFTWVNELPLRFQADGFFFSHAPLSHGMQEPYSEQILMWNRPGYGDMDSERRLHAKLKGGEIGVAGHCHQIYEDYDQPRLYENYIFNDTGCGCHPNFPLTATEVKSKEYIQVYRSELDEINNCGK